MKKRLVSALLMGTLIVSLFGACGNGDSEVEEPQQNQEEPQENNSQPEEKKPVDANVEVIGGMGEFNSALVSYIEENGFENQNYMISPTSYRAALCLATAGANGQTKQELLDALKFDDEDQMNAWYSMVYNETIEFQDSIQEEIDYLEELENDEDLRDMYSNVGNGQPDGAFKLVNSIWANESGNCEFTDEYIEKVDDLYSATADSKPADELTDAVNSWVNDSTNGQIPKISDDLSQVDLALINALYLRAGWDDKFYEDSTEQGDFTTFDGTTTQKDFMCKQDDILYYEEEGGKLIILPLDYGIKSAFILGEISDIDKALSEATELEVDVRLPKIDMESEFGKEELIGFLQDQGVELAFRDDGSADFSIMSNLPVYIDDIIQKTKIKTDEDGIEAAAVTIVAMMEATAAMPEEHEVKEFYADEPFQFLVYTELENSENEILFYGQVVE